MKEIMQTNYLQATKATEQLQLDQLKAALNFPLNDTWDDVKDFTSYDI